MFQLHITRTHRDEFSPQAKAQWWYLPWDVVKLALRPEVRETPRIKYATKQSGTLEPSSKWNQNKTAKGDEFRISSCHPSFPSELILMVSFKKKSWLTIDKSTGTIAWFSAKLQGFEKKHHWRTSCTTCSEGILFVLLVIYFGGLLTYEGGEDPSNNWRSCTSHWQSISGAVLASVTDYAFTFCRSTQSNYSSSHTIIRTDGHQRYQRNCIWGTTWKIPSIKR